MQYFILLIFFAGIFFSCGRTVTTGNASTPDTTETATVSEPVPLNDSLVITFPTGYSGEGMWTGTDTWGFNMRRDDEKVVFYHETGPGTPYQPLVIEAGNIPEELFDHTAESIYQKKQRRLNGYFYYKELPEKEVRNMKGRFFRYFPGNNSMREVLEITFAADTKDEVVNILSSIEEK